MHRRGALITGMVLAFSLLAGPFIWRTFGPVRSPRYFVGGSTSALASLQPDAPHLYLRRTVHLSERPRHAWIQIISRDRVHIYLNGRLLAGRSPNGMNGAILADATPYLQVGPNVIAISAEQFSSKRPAMVAVDGELTLASGKWRLTADSQWRSSTTFERGKTWWFMPRFDDTNWLSARLVSQSFRAAVPFPPRAVSEPPAGRWITTAQGGSKRFVVQRTFKLDGPPCQAWLRLTTTSMFRAAINGVVFDVHEPGLGTTVPLTPANRFYDVTPFFRRGTNTLAFALESPVGPPSLRCDLEIQEPGDRRTRIVSDEEWICRLVDTDEWLAAGSGSEQQCLVQSGDFGVMPWDAEKVNVRVSLPLEVQQRHAIGLTLAILAAGVFAIIACWLVDRIFAQAMPGAAPAHGTAYLALVLPTLVLLASWLATHDLRVDPAQIFRGRTIMVAFALVPAQWLLLWFWQKRAERRPVAVSLHEGSAVAKPRPSVPSNRVVVNRIQPSVLYRAIAIAVVVAGFAIRLPGVATRPLGADEANMYRCVQGFFERGFPSFVVHPELPPQYISTSELVYVGGALAELFFDNDRYVIRFPSVCWGTMTIALIYWAGRRLFHPSVGLIAATLYAFSPIAITMANFGRYPSQLQFFTLLTVYLYWRTLRGCGPIDRGALCATTLSAIAMFLSWEPSLLLALGMVLAGLLQRRGRLASVVARPAVWVALLAVTMAVSLQVTHRNFKQAQRMNYGTGASDTSLVPMWRHAHFEVGHFLRAASWSEDDTVPMIGLIASVLLAVRHPFAGPTRFLLIILVTTAVIIALALPVDADRYSYFLTPFLVLLVSAVVVAWTRELMQLAKGPVPAVGAYGRCVAGVIVAVCLFLGIELHGATREWDGTWQSMNPWAPSHRYLARCADFLSGCLGAGDIVLATQPYLLDHQLRVARGARAGVDPNRTYWLQTRLHLQAVLDDVRPIPLNRRDGTPMVWSLQSLAELFARPERIWLVVEKGHLNRLNAPEVNAFLRQNMNVAFEDGDAVVLLRGEQHWPAAVRKRDEESLQAAQIDFLRKQVIVPPLNLLRPWSEAFVPASEFEAESRDDGGPGRRTRP